jgi:hypothetical protein
MKEVNNYNILLLEERDRMKVIDAAVKGMIKVFIYFGFSMSTKLHETPLFMTLTLASVLIVISYTTIVEIRKAASL